MRITFLGTGTSQGVPVITCPCAICTSTDPRDARLRTSVMISHEGRNVVIDSGPDFRQQMLRTTPERLDGIVFTHEHKDHIAGLDDVRAFNYFQRERMNVYCTERVENALRREFAYAFEDPKYPGIPEIDLVRITQDAFEVAGIPFEPLEVMHHRMPVLGFRIAGLVYITDANFIAPEVKERIKGCDILVLNALRREQHPSHFTLSEAMDLVNELQPRQAYFTHISHQLGLHEVVERELPSHVRLAYDGLQLDFS